MAFFKILLIILAAAPVIGFALYYYAQMLEYIRGKNEREEELLESEDKLRAVRKANPKGSGKKSDEKKKTDKKKADKKAANKKDSGKKGKRAAKKREN